MLTIGLAWLVLAWLVLAVVVGLPVARMLRRVGESQRNARPPAFGAAALPDSAGFLAPLDG